MNNMSIRRLLYSFKRQWGREITYVQINSAVVNDATGTRVIDRSILQIPATKLPTQTARKFIQDIGYLAADKNFTYGALNDFNKVTFVIATQDLPYNFVPTLNGYVVIGGKRFEKVSMDDLFGEGFILIAQGVEGASPYAKLEVTANNRLRMQGVATCVVN